MKINRKIIKEAKNHRRGFWPCRGHEKVSMLRRKAMATKDKIIADQAKEIAELKEKYWELLEDFKMINRGDI